MSQRLDNCCSRFRKKAQNRCCQHAARSGPPPPRASAGGIKGARNTRQFEQSIVAENYSKASTGAELHCACEGDWDSGTCAVVTRAFLSQECSNFFSGGAAAQQTCHQPRRGILCIVNDSSIGATIIIVVIASTEVSSAAIARLALYKPNSASPA
jgi:hypothetical protein